MATFIAAVMTEAGHSLPADPGEHFPDAAGTTHERAINQLGATGIVGGQADGTYRPEAKVNRGQMATFLVRALEAITGQTLPSGDHFDDVADSPHAENVNKAAEAGITSGVGARTFAPGAHVQRAQMATFLVNLLDLLVADDHVTRPLASDAFHHVISHPGGPTALNGDAKISIAAGPEHIIVVMNNHIAVRTQDGAIVDEAAMPEFFESVLTDLAPSQPGGLYGGDPQVLFDPGSQRFFVVAMGNPYEPGEKDGPYCDPDAGCESYVHLAASKSARPASVTPKDWHLYSLDARFVDGEPTELQTDFSMLGVSRDAVIATARMYNEYYSRLPEYYGTDKAGYGKMWVASKNEVLAGTLNQQGWNEFVPLRPGGFFTSNLAPTVALDAATPSVAVYVAGHSCDIGIVMVEDPLGRASAASRTAVSSRERESCGRTTYVTQPGGTQLTPFPSGGYPGPELPVPAVYRKGSLWGVSSMRHDFGSGEVAVVRWWEIDVSQWPNEPTFVQEGIIGEDGVHTFYPAISVDPNGNAVVVVARSGPDEYPSMYYAWRAAGDMPGTMRSPRLIKAGSSVYESPEYGDFFGAATAPDGRIWVTGIVASGPRTWEPWVAWIRPR